MEGLRIIHDNVLSCSFACQEYIFILDFIAPLSLDDIFEVSLIRNVIGNHVTPYAY